MAKNESVIRVLLLSVLLALDAAVALAQDSAYEEAAWDRERIAPGLVWRHSHVRVNDTLYQNINILLVNTRLRELSIVNNSGNNISVAERVNKHTCIAAINGGFFDIVNGGSVTYIKSDGIIPEKGAAREWLTNSNINGCLLIDKKGDMHIEYISENESYDKYSEYPDVLVTGPILLSEGKGEPLPATSLVTTRHPRTVIGCINRNRIAMVTVDGRTPQSAGMTLEEMSEFMLWLRCTDAVNLDGGGSTTMWIRSKPFNGVVNKPCDNNKFDNHGARAVSSIITVN
ncbi:MAG: phosphodiester glycosidase family protein [Bacteroidales bacterium]|nr:phosphodiester glycosidase family protein [Bacteroidales bacterium]